MIKDWMMYNGIMIMCKFENGGEATIRHVTVDTLFFKDDQILLVKRAEKLLEGGKWGLVGGYVDRDENLQEAVMREAFEETGYRVHTITFFGVNDSPMRPGDDRQNISFVYFCQAGEKAGEPDDESTEQKWFSLDALPPREEIAFDHYKNIQNYLKYKKGEIKIPVF